MWATLVLVAMLSLCASDGRASASDETGFRVLQVRNTRSRQRCSQQCKEALVPGFKDFTKRKKRDALAVLYLKRRAANENDSITTNGTVTSATMPTTSPTTVLVTQEATLVPLPDTSSTTNGPLTATSATPKLTSSLSTNVTIQALTNTTQPATSSMLTTLSTIQTATQSRATTLVPEPAVVSLHTTSNSSTLTMPLTPKTTYATPASNETAEATTETSPSTLKSTDGTSSSTTKPSPPTSPQIYTVPSQPEPTGFIISTIKSATLRDADTSTVEIDVTTVIPNAIITYTTESKSQTSDLETINTTQLAKNDSLFYNTTDRLLVSVTGQTFTIVTEATPTITEIISVIKTPKTTLLPTTTHKQTIPIKTEEPPTSTATPKKVTTTSKTTLPTLQDTHRTGSTNLTPQSSTSIPGGSQNDVNGDKYLSATWPLARHLMDTSSLLAVLLFGIVFFLAVVFVFAAQAYESYKKKDYTQVDYLINGMYTDSEL
ncbi:uncharacterized protein C11orf24 homolog isoform X2 [Lissotriton helveticus]